MSDATDSERVAVMRAAAARGWIVLHSPWVDSDDVLDMFDPETAILFRVPLVIASAIARASATDRRTLQDMLFGS